MRTGPALGGLSVMDLLGLIEDEQKTAYMAPASGEDATASGGSMAAQAFQYWPSQITDTRDPGWTFKDIPGGSHPLASWAQGGQRAIAFDAVFTRDVAGSFTPLDVITGDIPEAVLLQGERNPDLRAIAKWLRWYTYPLYGSDNSVKPPPKLLLVFPGLQMGEDGSDELLCVMTQCDITYTDFWPDGSPRKMSASLAFVQIVQDGGQVTWRGRDMAIVGDGWGPLDYTKKVVK